MLYYYLAVSLIIVCFWLVLFWQDSTVEKDRLVSWLVLLMALLMAFIFWPIIVPLSAWELIRKVIRKETW
ncbi:hypothetical protein IQ255_01915 [Pleurocapsales cyanobacterium LEGE 10410]|nr:hypothetical protein [Pleurocapsales cyanobacterium LEGE 10410]